MRIETRLIIVNTADIWSHPDREIGVRIETAAEPRARNLFVVTPIVRSGCGLKPRRAGH